MDLELLHSDAEVARRGSITAAARGLGLTQPALSRHGIFQISNSNKLTRFY